MKVMEIMYEEKEERKKNWNLVSWLKMEHQSKRKETPLSLSWFEGRKPGLKNEKRDLTGLDSSDADLRKKAGSGSAALESDRPLRLSAHSSSPGKRTSWTVVLYLDLAHRIHPSVLELQNRNDLTRGRREKRRRRGGGGGEEGSVWPCSSGRPALWPGRIIWSVRRRRGRGRERRRLL